MIKPEVIAWAMASEGSFSIQKVRQSLQPKISINNTSKEYLSKFIDMVGFGNVGVHCWNKRNPNWNTIYHWYLSSHQDCLKFCQTIVDYMPIKQMQVRLLIAFCKNGLERCKHFPRLPVGEYDWDIYEHLKYLNRRGRDGA